MHTVIIVGGGLALLGAFLLLAWGIVGAVVFGVPAAIAGFVWWKFS